MPMLAYSTISLRALASCDSIKIPVNSRELANVSKAVAASALVYMEILKLANPIVRVNHVEVSLTLWTLA